MSCANRALQVDRMINSAASGSFEVALGLASGLTTWCDSRLNGGRESCRNDAAAEGPLPATGAPAFTAAAPRDTLASQPDG